ncbi:hypothetical protein HYV64_00695 [Candidatus Shapirobacteria bacterium]|nr:hypothetical protein [Candidatus Shapirobacteria bacterium]
MATEQIRYYDVSINQNMSQLTGQTLDTAELVGRKIAADPILFKSRGLVDQIGNFDFDPIGIKKSSRWESAVATMIYAISDQIPNREEIKRGRQIIEVLPKSIKEQINREFILGFLPYFLTGFNFHTGDHFVEDSNTVKDGATFIEEVHGKTEIRTSSLLCAHRESHKVKELSLRDHIHTTKAVRALNLFFGLVGNSTSQTSIIDWYQQFSTKRASSNIFPEIFIGYLKTGKISDLVRVLDLHQRELEQLMANATRVDTNISLKSLDLFTTQVETFLSDRYGVDWASHEKPGQSDALTDITTGFTLPEVTRLMPFYGQSAAEIRTLEAYRQINIDMAEDQRESDLVKQIFDWFVQNQRMTKYSKALFETAQYYLWGSTSARDGLVCLGIDRDHSNYQRLAFQQGFLDTQGTTNVKNVPLLYARRRDAETSKGILSEISFRQFWRDTN